MSDRKLIALTGADREGFLQGLITNDVERAKSDGIVYAALLTPQGKYLADFFVYAEADRLLIDVAASLAPGLIQRLSMYRLRADVQIELTDLAIERGTGPAPPGALSDPRHPALGWRKLAQIASDDGSDWAALRVANLIPQSGVELTQDSYILEAGFERLSGVDFRKGCYVGQEVTARMKHKTELRKGLALVSIDGEASQGAPITDEADRAVGTLLSRAGDRAIAYLRFERAKGPLKAGSAVLHMLS